MFPHGPTSSQLDIVRLRSGCHSSTMPLCRDEISQSWTKKCRNTGSHGTVDMPWSKLRAVMAPRIDKLRRRESGTYLAVQVVCIVAKVEWPSACGANHSAGFDLNSSNMVFITSRSIPSPRERTLSSPLSSSETLTNSQFRIDTFEVIKAHIRNERSEDNIFVKSP